MLLALTALDKATIALVIVTGLLALLALLQLRAFSRSEARRTQPVAIAQLFKARDQYSKYAVYLTNEGTGTAFNVRFGVSIDGTEYAVGGGGGHRYVVGPGMRVPEDQAKYLEVEVDVAAFGLGRGARTVDERAIFWARYENAFGAVYETANPADPLAEFDVHRSRPWRRRLKERRQERRRTREAKAVRRRLQEELDVAESGTKLPLHRRFARRFTRR